VRRRLVGVALAIAVVAVAIWWWKHGGDAEPPKDSPIATQHRAFDPAHPELTKLAWLGQRGVTDRVVAGIVVGDNGPIAGATVRLATRFSTAGALTERRVKTDAAGAFDLGPQLAGWYVVLADAPKLTPTSQWIDVRNPEQPTDHLVLVLHACDATVHGVVRDTGGGVVANARISREIGIATGLVAEADAQGAYDLCVPIGDMTVVARADGYALAADSLYAIGRVRHDFALGPEATISGKVVRTGDRAPVANAILELHGSTQRVEFASSDATGHFTFAGVSPGRYGIVATAEELASARPVDAVAMVGGANEVTVELAPSFSVAGKVVETGTTKPIAGLIVRMTSKLWSERRNMEAVSQGDGSFAIEHVLPGEYQATVNGDKPAKEPAPIKVATADATGIVIEADRRATIAGRIVRGGKPVDGADVMIKDTSNHTTTDAEGRYTLRNLKPGSVTVYGESRRLGAFANGPTLTIAAGEARTLGDLELNLAGAIAGKVVDQHDAPVSGVFVSFSLLHGRDFGIATTGEDGSFSVRALEGGGDYVYQVRASARSPIIYKPASGERFPPISVADGTAHNDGLVIKIQIDRLAITGRVVDPANKPIADVTVRATPAGKYDFSAPAATTDASGAFTIPNLVAGNYDVTAHGVDGDARESAVAAGRSDLVLHFAGLGSIEGTFAGFAEVPEILTVGYGGASQFPLFATITGTTFRIEHVPAGEYRVLARSKSGADSAQITVTAGAPTKVALAQRGHGTITGTLRDATSHAPIADATCGTYGEEANMRGLEGPTSGKTDASGAFRIENATNGKNRVSCGSDKAYGDVEIAVVADQTVHVEIESYPTPPSTRHHAGLELEGQLGEVMVKSVEKGGPADQAGVLVGDIIQKINGAAAPSRLSYALNEIEYAARPKLDIERGNKQLVLTLTFATSP